MERWRHLRDGTEARDAAQLNLIDLTERRRHNLVRLRLAVRLYILVSGGGERQPGELISHLELVLMTVTLLGAPPTIEFIGREVAERHVADGARWDGSREAGRRETREDGGRGVHVVRDEALIGHFLAAAAWAKCVGEVRGQSAWAKCVGEVRGRSAWGRGVGERGGAG